MSSLVFDAGLFGLLSDRVSVSDKFRAMLVTSTYAPDKSRHTIRSDVKGEAAGPGYTAGGAEAAVAADLVADATEISLGGVVWSDVTISGITGCVYYRAGGGAETLVAYIDFVTPVQAVSGAFQVDRSLLRVRQTAPA